MFGGNSLFNYHCFLWVLVYIFAHNLQNTPFPCTFHCLFCMHQHLSFNLTPNNQVRPVQNLIAMRVQICVFLYLVEKKKTKKRSIVPDFLITRIS